MSDVTELIPVESQSLVSKVTEFCGSIVSVQINNPQEFDHATELTKQLLAYGNELKAKRKEAKKPYDDKATTVQSFFVPVISAVDNAKKKIKAAIWEYQQAQERKRQAEQARLNAEAEARRRAAEEAAAKEREKAEALRAQGREDLADRADLRADAKESRAAEIVAPVAQSAVPKTLPHGVSAHEIWVGFVDDENAFKAWAVQSPDRLVFLTVDGSAWNRHAKNVKAVMEVPGARIVKKLV